MTRQGLAVAFLRGRAEAGCKPPAFSPPARRRRPHASQTSRPQCVGPRGLRRGYERPRTPAHIAGMHGGRIDAPVGLELRYGRLRRAPSRQCLPPGDREGHHRIAIHDAMVAALMSTSTSAPRPTPTVIDIGVATRARKGQRLISTKNAGLCRGSTRAPGSPWQRPRSQPAPRARARAVQMAPPKLSRSRHHGGIVLIVRASWGGF
jgi:hypothetical protein